MFNSELMSQFGREDGRLRSANAFVSSVRSVWKGKLLII